MSAGVFKDPFIDCDACKHRLFGSQVLMTWDMTVAKVRKAAVEAGWQTGIENVIYEDDAEIRRGPRLDLCPSCRKQAA